MVVRVWHGWTRAEDAEEYEQLLIGSILPGIAARNISGYQGSELFRRAGPTEVEFKTVLWFESRDAAREFGGEDDTRAAIPPAAKALLLRFREEARHYEVRKPREG